MIAIDIILTISLAVYLIAWWLTNLKRRRLVLLVSALIALMAGLIGILEHRWQGAIGVISATIFLFTLFISKCRKTKKRQGTPWVSGTIVSLFVAFSCFLIYLFPVPDLPAPSGEYPVGTQTFELVDESRLGVLAAKDNTPRRLLIRVWYPASNVRGLTARPYFTDEEVNTSAGDMSNGSYFLQYLKYSKTNSHTNAPLIEIQEDRKLPVVFYSHAYMSFAGQNTILMEELASHGYIVYSIQHTYESLPTIFPNNDIEEAVPIVAADIDKPIEFSNATKKAFAGVSFDERYEGSINSRKEAVASGAQIETISADVWLKDRIFVLDKLEQGNVPESVHNIVYASDFIRTAQMGMSFGGSTSGALCMTDSRCAAAINLDGNDFHGTPFEKNIPVPLLMLYSDFNNPISVYGGNEDSMRRGWNDFSYERPEAAGLRNDIYRVQIPGLKHMGFSDFSLFARSPVQESLFGPGDIIEIQNDFVLGFLDKHLLHNENAFPEAAYAKHASTVEKNEISDVQAWWLSQHPQDAIERILLKTSNGEIELALYPKKSPLFVNHLIERVDAGSLTKAYLTMNDDDRILLVDHAFANPELSFDVQSNSIFIDSQKSKLDKNRESSVGFVLRGIRILEEVQAIKENENEFSDSDTVHYSILVDTVQNISP